MAELTPQGMKIIDYVAQRHGVSTEAAMILLEALASGNGTMAQFNHPELGGLGQWSRSGINMIGDIGNHALKATVDALCCELADLVGQETLWARTGGSPLTASGSQNGISYDYSRSTRRLSIKRGDHVVTYDTGEHDITGISQQQSEDANVTFTSHTGPVKLSDLRVVSGSPPFPAPDDAFLKLERLAELKDRGVISEEEFISNKRELLDRI